MGLTVCYQKLPQAVAFCVSATLIVSRSSISKQIGADKRLELCMTLLVDTACLTYSDSGEPLLPYLLSTRMWKRASCVSLLIRSPPRDWLAVITLLTKLGSFLHPGTGKSEFHGSLMTEWCHMTNLGQWAVSRSDMYPFEIEIFNCLCETSQSTFSLFKDKFQDDGFSISMSLQKDHAKKTPSKTDGYTISMIKK